MRLKGEAIFMGAKAPEAFKMKNDSGGETEYPGTWELAFADAEDTLNVTRIRAVPEFVLSPIPNLGDVVQVDVSFIKKRDFGTKAGTQVLQLWGLVILKGSAANGRQQGKAADTVSA